MNSSKPRKTLVADARMPVSLGSFRKRLESPTMNRNLPLSTAVCN